MSWAKSQKEILMFLMTQKKGIKDVDCIMTDKWISMGDKVNIKKKKSILKKYQTNDKLLKLSKVITLLQEVMRL